MKTFLNITAILLCVTRYLHEQLFLKLHCVIKGKVTDATTGDPIRFANIAVKSQLPVQPRAPTAFINSHSRLLPTPCIVTYVGYTTKSKAIVPDQREQIT